MEAQSTEPSTSDADISTSFTKCYKCGRNSSEKSPKLLSCLHNFCSECLEVEEIKVASPDGAEGTGSTRGDYRCPVCQTVTPSHLAAENQFIQELVSRDKDAGTEHMCHGCVDDNETVIASSYCTDCQDWLCNQCVSAHRRVRITKDHNIEPKENVTQKIDHKNKVEYCRVHPNEMMKCFCTVCEVLTCRDCQLADHQRHDFRPVELASNEHKTWLLQKADHLQSGVTSMEQGQDFLRQKIEDINTTEQRESDNIKQFAIIFITEINKRGRAMLGDLKALCGTKRTDLEKRHKELEQHLDSYKHSISFIEDVIKHASNSSLLQTKKLMTNHLVNPKPVSIPNPSYRFDVGFGFNPQVIRDMMPKLGQLTYNGMEYSGDNLRRRMHENHLALQHAQQRAIHQQQLHRQQQQLQQAGTSGQSGSVSVVSSPGSISVVNYRASPVPASSTGASSTTGAGAGSSNPAQIRVITSGNWPPPHLGTPPPGIPGAPRAPSGSPAPPLGIQLPPQISVPSGSNVHVGVLNRPGGSGSTTLPSQSTANPSNIRMMVNLPEPSDNTNTSASVSPAPPTVPPVPPFSQSAPDSASHGTATGPSSARSVSGAEAISSTEPNRNANANAARPNSENGFPFSFDADPRRLVNVTVKQERRDAGYDTSNRPHTSSTEPVNQPFMAPPNPPSGVETPSTTPVPTPSPTPSSMASQTPASTVSQADQQIPQFGAVLSIPDTAGFEARDRNIYFSPNAVDHLDYRTVYHPVMSPFPIAPTPRRQDLESQEDDPNEDYCSVCHDGGHLLCCKSCPRVFHFKCHVPESKPTSADWTCGMCVPESELRIESEPSGFVLINGERKRKAHNGGLLPQELKACERILLELYCHPNSVSFHVPVPKSTHLYYTIIKTPMDFKTIQSKLNPKHFNHYKSVQGFINDICQVFANCKTYNQPGSEIRQWGEVVETYFMEALQRILPFIHFQAPSESREPSPKRPCPDPSPE